MATVLIGYDVEACAIGEGLACLGAHGMGEAIDRTTTAKALQIIRRNHETHEAPATLFVCGRTLVHNVEALEPFVDHPLFDIQQHTYSHTLLKDDHWKGGTFLASPVVAIEQEVRQTSEALERLLGVRCLGLRTPHGYHLGLTDRPEMLAALHRRGIRFVSSWARNAAGVNPTPLSVQPFWYEDQGFADLLEIPFQHWLDGIWFEEFGIDRGVEFGAVLRHAVDEIVAGDLVYGACFHDWAQIRYREVETGWVASLITYARSQGAELRHYADYHRRLSAAVAAH
jgi:peptidoglycan/xylan/chitin deacetylase (PgdA/CDA1 family)